jgi:DNA-binding transcriptional MocR family regulator
VELPGDIDTLQLNEKLQASAIRIGPGILFSASGKYRNCLRLNYSDKPSAVIENAVRTIGTQCTRMLQAMIQVA